MKQIPFAVQSGYALPVEQCKALYEWTACKTTPLLRILYYPSYLSFSSGLMCVGMANVDRECLSIQIHRACSVLTPFDLY